MVLDKSGKKTKVEPRIMRVLQILVDNSPNVVSREQLIEEVWDNYGGADDALNQAISHLRKILHDTKKDDRIIETVVKKGYRFKGHSAVVEKEKVGGQALAGFSKMSLVIIGILLISLLSIGYIKCSSDNFVPKAPPHEESKVDTPAPDVDRQ